MNVFDLQAVLGLDSSKFERGLSKAKSLAGTFGSGIATAAKVGLAAVTAAGTAMVGFGKSSVDAATSFESAFTGVKKTVDATEEEYATLSKWIMDASTKMASSKEEIAGTMEIAGQLGISGVAGLEAFTETMIMLGDSTNLNAEEAAGALARFMNITGDIPENAGKLGSAIVDLGNHFATTESDIVSMATRLASAGTIAGLSATDILGLSTAMSSVGINAEAGGTAMAQTLQMITKAVAEGGDELEVYASLSGMTAEEFAKTWKSKPIDAVTAFIRGLKNVKDSGGEVDLVLDQLGLNGIRQTNMLKSLALASDMMGDAVNMSNQAYKEGNALQDEASKRYATTESQARQTAEAFKNLKVVVGQELIPVYGELMSFSKEALVAMQEGFEKGGLGGLMESAGKALSDALKMLSSKLPEFVTLGTKLLSALGEGLLQNLDTIIESGVEVIGILGDAFVKGVPAVIDAGLEILKALLKAFSENIDEVLAATKTLFSNLGKAFEKHGKDILEMGAFIVETLFNSLIDNIPQIIGFVTQMISNLLSWIDDNADKLVDGAVAMIKAIADGLIKNLPTIVKATIDLLKTMVQALTDPVNLQMVMGAAVEVFTTLVSSLANEIPTLIPVMVEAVANMVSTLIENADQLIDAAIVLIKSLADGLVNSLPTLLEKAPVIIGDLLSALVENAPDIIKAAVEIIAQLVIGIAENVPELKNSAKDIVAALYDGVAELAEKLNEIGDEIMDKIYEGLGIDDVVPEWGKDFIQSFMNGLTGFPSYEAIRDGMTTVADWIRQYIHFSEPDKGPLSNFESYAPDMIKTFASGIRNNLGLIEDAMEEASGTVEAGLNMSPTISANYEVGSSFANVGLENKMTEILNMLQEYMPSYATAEDMENMSINVDNREFGRLVREVG